MIDSLYRSMTGLVGFTSSLDNLSNNVANLNTPGYKGNDLIFRDLGSHNSTFNDGSQNSFGYEIGQGVQVSGSLIRFTQGDVQETGVDTDIAISGDAFFVLQDPQGNHFYTRSGQFRFDSDGYLADPATGFRVVSLDSGARTGFINVNDFLMNSAVATSEINLSGVLDNSTVVGGLHPPEGEEPIEVTMYDMGGKEFTINVEFEKQSGRAWSVRLLDEAGALVAPVHEVEFTTLGSIVSSTSEFVFDYQNFQLLEQEALDESFSPGATLEYSDGLSEDVITDFTLEEAYTIARDSDTSQFDRSGSYSFTSQGYLVSSGSDLRIASRGENGDIADYYIGDILQTPSVSTTEIELEVNLDANVAIGGIDPPIAESGITIDYVDGDNGIQQVYLRFLRDDANEWSLLAEDAEGVNYDTAGSLFFNDAGELEVSTSALLIRSAGSDGEDIELSLQDADGNSLFNVVDGASEFTQLSYDGNELGNIVSIEFDQEGIATIQYSNGDVETGPQLAVVSLSGSSIENITMNFEGLSGVASGQNNINIDSSNGLPFGQLATSRLNEFGELVFQYSNGESTSSDAIALASIVDKSRLFSIGSSLFQTQNTKVVLGTARDGLAELSAGSLELSNVELSREFADIIIVQRGYQASSQVLNVTNELIEELYNSIKGG